MTFKSGSEEINILWDYDNITRACCASLWIFTQRNNKCFTKIIFKQNPDVSSHFVDLAIPQIPNIGCKRNSSGRNIIERIQLDKGHGEYLHYKALSDEGQTQHFFFPYYASSFKNHNYGLLIMYYMIQITQIHLLSLKLQWLKTKNY